MCKLLRTLCGLLHLYSLRDLLTVLRAHGFWTKLACACSARAIHVACLLFFVSGGSQTKENLSGTRIPWHLLSGNFTAAAFCRFAVLRVVAIQPSDWVITLDCVPITTQPGRATMWGLWCMLLRARNWLLWPKPINALIVSSSFAHELTGIFLLLHVSGLNRPCVVLMALLTVHCYGGSQIDWQMVNGTWMLACVWVHVFLNPSSRLDPEIKAT